MSRLLIEHVLPRAIVQSWSLPGALVKETQKIVWRSDWNSVRLFRRFFLKNLFIQLGGGGQERLGLHLKNSLSQAPSILCTGAALAFLSGQQVAIPTWVDRFYLGWLFRCVDQPRVFIPRYLKSFRLLYLLFRYGQRLPVN